MIQVGLEVGERRVFASALGWPGWTRSGKGEEAAIEELLGYLERYRPVAERAGLRLPAAVPEVDVVERVKGNATTDFGAPGAAFSWDAGPLRRGERQMMSRVTVAAWEYFDEVVAGAPPEMRKGPRGGGRDRDKIRDHVLGAEVEYGRKLGLERWKPERADRAEILARRQAVADRLASADLQCAPFVERGWTPRYACRRGVWHVLDHAWEIEDKSER